MSLTLFPEGIHPRIPVEPQDLVCLQCPEANLGRSLLYSLAERAALFSSNGLTYHVFLIDGDCLSGVVGQGECAREVLWKTLLEARTEATVEEPLAVDRVSIAVCHSFKESLACLRGILHTVEQLSREFPENTRTVPERKLSLRTTVSPFPHHVKASQNFSLLSLPHERQISQNLESFNEPSSTSFKSFSESVALTDNCIVKTPSTLPVSNVPSHEYVLILVDGIGNSSGMLGSEYYNTCIIDLREELRDILRQLLASAYVSIVFRDSLMGTKTESIAREIPIETSGADGTIEKMLRNLLTKSVLVEHSSMPNETYRLCFRQFHPSGSLQLEWESFLGEPLHPAFKWLRSKAA